MEIFQNHPLAPYTTVKIGGPADTFIITATTTEFLEALKKYGQGGKNLFLLGNGSNVLISDAGFRGTVIKNQATAIEYLPINIVKADSGTQLSSLITDTINHYLSGLEEFAYIPSTLGGAIAGNIHGVNQNNFDKFLETIDIYDLKEGKTRQLNARELRWAYDSSEFQSHPEWVILSASLNLFPGNTSESKKIIADIILKKSQTQPLNSLGCVFKNPPNDSAGRLIDQELHLKSFRLGDVQISPLHANFFLNLGQASADDYYTLVKKVQQEAKNQLHLDLETEIKFLGNFNSRPLPSV